MIKYLLTIVLIALGVVIYLATTRPAVVPEPVVVEVPVPTPVPVQIAFSKYLCDNNLALSATYYDLPNASVATSEAAPTPTGTVTINLPADRTLSLNQTISASGVRYTNSDETIEFWNKGRGVLFSEKSVTPDVYTNCIEVAEETSEKTTVYHNGTIGFTLRYPTEYTVDEAYSYKALGPGKAIAGIKFTIPESMATGTNLANNSYLSIETLSLATDGSCKAGSFIGDSATSTTITESNNMTYSVATSSEGAAGNRFDESVFAFPTMNKCLAVRYLIHSTVLENYASGTVKAFDRTALTDSFDTIRESLIVN